MPDKEVFNVQDKRWTLSGARLQQISHETAVSLDDVSHGRPFTPHLDVWNVRDKVCLIIAGARNPGHS